MSDPTETIRKELLAEINAQPGSREALEAQHGQVWDTNQLREDFEVLGFGAPLSWLVARATAKRARSSSRRPHATILALRPTSSWPGDARGSCGQPWEPLPFDTHFIPDPLSRTDRWMH